MPVKRYSRQRELIYRALLASKADMVYQMLKPENPNLSLGTVYRNLNLLAEEGIIVRMPFPVERYDADTTPHPHFQCQCCGQVSDLNLPYDKRLDEQVAELGHEVAGYYLPEFAQTAPKSIEIKSKTCYFSSTGNFLERKEFHYDVQALQVFSLRKYCVQSSR